MKNITCEISAIILIIQMENQNLKGIKRYAQSLQLVKGGVQTYSWFISDPSFHLADLILEWRLAILNELVEGMGN